uniref:Uncharacterized protein n=1 Tax=Sphaerodactylus townsendi TaxID=933632 RepID=A0ACB8E7A5_9SAUR
MAALRGLLRWRRCRFQGVGGDGGPEPAHGCRRLRGSSAGSGSDGWPSGLSVAAAAGAAGGALGWFLRERFHEERPATRGGLGDAAQGRGLLPIPVAAAAKETTVVPVILMFHQVKHTILSQMERKSDNDVWE